MCSRFRTVTRRVLETALLFAILFGFAPALHAQDFKVGDQVTVDMLNREQTGTIIEETRTGWFRVELPSPTGRGTIKPVFPPSRLTLVQSGAANETTPASSELREWEDDSGRFKIMATLIGQTDDKVRLRKEDGRVVEVDVNQLSEADQQYLTDLAAAASSDNPFAGGTMEGGGGGTGTETASSGGISVAAAQPISLTSSNRILLADTTWSVDADPEQASASVHQPRAASLADTGYEHPFHSTISAPGFNSDETLAVFATTNPFDRERSQIQIVNLADSNAAAFDLNFGGVNVTDISPDGKTVLTAQSSHSPRDGRMDFFAIESGQPMHLKGWKMGKVKSARFLDDDNVMIALDDGGIRIVNWRGEEVIGSVPTNKSPNPVLSSNSRLLALHQDGLVFVIDLAEQQTTGSLDLPGDSAWLGFSPDGHFLAALAGDGDVRIWNMEDGELDRQISLPSPGARGKLTWVDDRYLLINGLDLLDTELRTIVWKYSGATPVRTNNGNFWFIPKSSNSDITALLPAEFPDERLASRSASLSVDDLYVLQPGDDISLELDLPFSRRKSAAIEDQLRQQLEDNGFRVTDNADIVLRGTNQRGKRETIEYGDMMRGPWRRGDETKVTFTPNTCSLTLMKDGRKLWSVARRYAAPQVVMEREDKSIQQMVSEACQPKPHFFENANLPQYLSLLPGSKNSLGSSTFTSTGLRNDK
ncbi:MAG: SHD1 domain-containing protein [Pirellulaceae bacterium]